MPLRERLLATLALLLLTSATGQSSAGTSASALPLLLAAWQVRKSRIAKKPPLQRERIQRADGGWRGSTLNGYIVHGSNTVYKKNFRCTKKTFGTLLGQMQAGGYCADNKTEP
jgi:hypothetical protein